MASGFLVGTVLGFGSPTAFRVGGAVENSIHKFISEHGTFVFLPKHGLGTLLVILSVAFLFCAVRLYVFFRRVCVSWFAGLVSGVGVVWLFTSALAFTLLGLTGSFLSLVVLVVGVAATLVTFYRDAGISETGQMLSESDSDSPISSKDEDILGRDNVVASLVRAVVSDQAPVVALTGSYGDGKTSILNLLSRALETRKDVVCIHFSSWLPTDQKTLVSTLLSTVFDEIETRFFVPKIKRDFVAVTRLLFAVLPKVPGPLVDLFEKPSQEQKINELRRNLARLPVRIAVLLDDMDRMRGKELDVLFKLLRGVTEFPQFTYVCAFDRNALVDTLRGNDKNQSREKVGHFLEKFFPDDIPLPKIDEAHLAAELEKRFYAICDRNDLIADPAERQQFKDQFRSLWATTLKGYFSNLRRVKLFTNRLTRSLPLVGAEVNLMDFVLLEIVRMMNPVLYEEIFRDARYFMFPQWRFITWLQVVSPDDKDAQRRRVSYFDELFRGLARPPEGIALALLKEIFPTVDAYLAGGDIPGSIANDQEKALLQRRIYHPEFFPRYFLFSVPSDLFGEKELTDFIAAMNDKKDVAQCVSVFKAKYGELQELPMKRWDFLSHVRTSLKRFSTAPKHALPVAISHLSAQLEEAEAAGSFDAMTGIRIVFGAINQLDGTVDAQILLEETIRDAASDFFATRVLNESIARTNRLLKHEIVLDKHALEKTFCDRMTKRYELGGALSFFPKEGRPDIAPLGRWALCGADGQEQVHRYLRREFVSAHWKIGRFLSYFFPRPDDVYPGIDSLKAIEVYFPAQELRSLLGEYGDSSASSPEESRAIHDFRTQYPSGP